MRYTILESVKIKNTRYEFIEYGDKMYSVVKYSKGLVTHLFINRDHALAYEFFKKTVGY